MKDFMSYKEVAERLGVSLNTLKKIIARGELRVNQISPRVKRVSQEEYKRFTNATILQPPKTYNKRTKQ